MGARERRNITGMMQSSAEVMFSDGSITEETCNDSILLIGITILPGGNEEVIVIFTADGAVDSRINAAHC